MKTETGSEFRVDVHIVTDQIAAEVARAMSIHKGITSLHEGYSVILEELDEFWEQVKTNPKKLSSADRDMRLAELRKELIQTAAMCVRSIVDLKL